MTHAEVQRILTSKIFCKKSTSSFPTPYNPGRNILAICSVLVQFYSPKVKRDLKCAIVNSAYALSYKLPKMEDLGNIRRISKLVGTKPGA